MAAPVSETRGAPGAGTASKARKGAIREQVALFLLPPKVAASDQQLMGRKPGVPEQVGRSNLELVRGFLPSKKALGPRGTSSDHCTPDLRTGMGPSAESSASSVLGQDEEEGVYVLLTGSVHFRESELGNYQKMPTIFL